MTKEERRLYMKNYNLGRKTAKQKAYPLMASMKSALEEIKRLISLGNKIQYSYNDNWCIVDGKAFNVNKKVLIERGIYNDSTKDERYTFVGRW